MKQPPIKLSEAILYFGMVAFFIGFVISLADIRRSLESCAYDCSPFPWPLIIGGVIGLVCFIIAVRDES